METFDSPEEDDSLEDLEMYASQTAPVEEDALGNLKTLHKVRAPLEAVNSLCRCLEKVHRRPGRTRRMEGRGDGRGGTWEVAEEEGKETA